MMKKLLNNIVCAACVAIMSAGGALSADFTWTGAIDNTNWKNADNWQGGNVGIIDNGGGDWACYQGRVIVETGGDVVWDIEGHDSKAGTFLPYDTVLQIDNRTNLTINATDKVGSFYANLQGGLFVGTGSSFRFNGLDRSGGKYADMLADTWSIDGYVSLSGVGSAGEGNVIENLKLASYGELHFEDWSGIWAQNIGGVSAFLDLSLTGGFLEKKTRTLVTGLLENAVIGGERGDAFFFNTKDGVYLESSVSSADELKNAGDYFVYREGHTLKVDYMSARAVPEPAIATFALVAFSAFLLRRRRN